tara:strand:+ start:266 stop:508 length:243 start_codon:yes stop_codon:yes gene_type:complete
MAKLDKLSNDALFQLGLQGLAQSVQGIQDSSEELQQLGETDDVSSDDQRQGELYLEDAHFRLRSGERSILYKSYFKPKDF